MPHKRRSHKDLPANQYATPQAMSTHTSQNRSGLVFVWLGNGKWDFITTKEAAIDLIKSQPFYATKT